MMNKPMRIIICLCANRDDKITHVSSSIYATFVRSSENEIFLLFMKYGQIIRKLNVIYMSL
jgi:hypothetical protein